MDSATVKAIFQENLLNGFSIGLAVWVVAWGLNRVYLFFKSSVSF